MDSPLEYENSLQKKMSVAAVIAIAEKVPT
jgi:hypothetical protein